MDKFIRNTQRPISNLNHCYKWISSTLALFCVLMVSCENNSINVREYLDSVNLVLENYYSETMEDSLNPEIPFLIKPKNIEVDTLRQFCMKEFIDGISIYKDSTIVFHKVCSGSPLRFKCSSIFFSEEENLSLNLKRLQIESCNQITNKIYFGTSINSLAN